MLNTKCLKIVWSDTEWWDEIPLSIFEFENYKEKQSHIIKKKLKNGTKKELSAEYCAINMKVDSYQYTFLTYHNIGINKKHKIDIGVLLIVTNLVENIEKENIKLVQFIQGDCICITSNYEIVDC
jgi:hypothetical protein